MQLFKLLSFVAVAVGAIAGVNAMPAAEPAGAAGASAVTPAELNLDDLPDFIPGPGLPSLKELGLTKADLYKPVTEEQLSIARERYGRSLYDTKSALEKRQATRCYGADRPNVQNAIACFHYLNNLGSTTCFVPATGGSVFCSAGDAHWHGDSWAFGSSVSSPCNDVAFGGLWVIDNCTWDNRCAGTNGARNNYNLRVSIWNF